MTIVSSAQRRLDLAGPSHVAPGNAVAFRGDLRSITGYGYETRALAALFPSSWEILGVDIHANPADDQGGFPGRLISDDTLIEMARRANRRLYVVNHTPPGSFTYVPGAVNIGAFAWETDILPPASDWRELIHAMDFMWAKTSFHKRMLSDLGVPDETPIIPWPMDFDVAPAPAHPRGDIEVDYVARMGEPTSKMTAHDLQTMGAPLFLSISSMAPRKGLAVLLSEWRDYVSEGGPGVLMLKLRPIHSERRRGEGAALTAEMVREAGLRPGDPVRLGVTYADLDLDDLRSLSSICDAYVTATYGEGFGGPVAEALTLAKPVIAPRHTSLADLLPAGHPLEVASSALRVGLFGNPSIYPPVSLWNIPVRGAVRKALDAVAAMSPAQREGVGRRARDHAEAFCSVPVVAGSLQRFFERLDGADAWR